MYVHICVYVMLFMANLEPAMALLPQSDLRTLMLVESSAEGVPGVSTSAVVVWFPKPTILNHASSEGGAQKVSSTAAAMKKMLRLTVISPPPP